MIVGERIREVREMRGLSQREVARRVDELRGDRKVLIGAAGLSRIETGDRYPTLRTVEALAKVLDVTFVVGPRGTVILEHHGEATTVILERHGKVA